MIFVQANSHRVGIPSLATFLRASLTHGPRMDTALMRPEEAARCRWLGYGIGKGVTDPDADITVFAVPNGSGRGLHGDLIQGFPLVDPTPACYNADHMLGFGEFIRWVLFADPKGGPGVLGVDFSLAERPTAGVATDMLTIARVAQALVRAGVPSHAELVLLNGRMCEPEEIAHWRAAARLVTLGDWAKASECFRPGTNACPRCGMATTAARFCAHCGCRKDLVWQRNAINRIEHARSARATEVSHGMENGLTGFRRECRPVPQPTNAAHAA